MPARHACGAVGQNIIDRESHPANARFTATVAGLDGNQMAMVGKVSRQDSGHAAFVSGVCCLTKQTPSAYVARRVVPLPNGPILAWWRDSCSGSAGAVSACYPPDCSCATLEVNVDLEKPASAEGDEWPLGVASPARRALREVGITRLAQLTSFSEKELLKLHGVGPKAIRLLREALAQRGMTFAQSDSASAGSGTMDDTSQ